MANAYGRREEPDADYFPLPENRNSTEPRRAAESPTRKRSSPINDRMASAADRDSLKGHPGVSPELIAEITERVKKEGSLADAAAS